MKRLIKLVERVKQENPEVYPQVKKAYQECVDEIILGADEESIERTINFILSLI